MREKIGIGITIPRIFLEEIDAIRKDVPRSRYILRMLESSSAKLKTDSLDGSFDGLRSSESKR